MSKFIHALSVVTIATVLLIGESPTQAQTNLSAKIASSPGRSSRSVAINAMSAAAKSALTQGAEILSLPTFTGSFTTDEVTYPFIIVGGSPPAGGITLIKTDLIPLEFVFFDANDFFIRDANGDVVVLGPSPKIIRRTVESPLFRNAPYTIDTTQFTDAIQQASFFPLKGPDWHTLLDTPKVHKPVRIAVPAGLASNQPAFVHTFAICLNLEFLESQIQTILEALKLPLDHLPLFLSLDTIVYLGDRDRQACETQSAGIVGFHEAADRFATKSRVGIQVFGYSAWLTPEAAGIPDFEDVAFLAHEVVEAVNDPFVGFIGADSPLINLVPPYINAGGGCQDNLETGDFIEGLRHSSFPVTLNNFTYHPQNEQLIQWFSREVPSSAFQGAYSYPDTSLLSSPSTPCSSSVASN
jgi:hypothetical protein